MVWVGSACLVRSHLHVCCGRHRGWCDEMVVFQSRLTEQFSYFLELRVMMTNAGLDILAYDSSILFWNKIPCKPCIRGCSSTAELVLHMSKVAFSSAKGIAQRPASHSRLHSPVCDWAIGSVEFLRTFVSVVWPQCIDVSSGSPGWTHRGSAVDHRGPLKILPVPRRESS